MRSPLSALTRPGQILSLPSWSSMYLDRFTRRTCASVSLWLVSVACDRDRTPQPNEPPSRVAAGQSARDASLAAERGSLERVRQDSVNRAQPGYVVDSI